MINDDESLQQENVRFFFGLDGIHDFTLANGAKTFQGS